MSSSIALHQQMRDSINKEIADRTKSHQSTIARLKAAGAPFASVHWLCWPMAIHGLITLFPVTACPWSIPT